MALTVNITGGMDLDQGSQVNLSATVTENGLPPLGTVVYAWSADRGSFIGATDQAAATYEADFSDASDVDVTITCAVTRAAETNPTIASASLSSMAQLGITNPVLNMYVTDTEQGTNGSYTVWWQSGSADSSIDGNSDSELSSDLTVSIIQWNPTDDRFSLNTTGTGNLASFFSSNTTQSVYVILNDGSYYEITNAMYGNGGGNWVRWDLTDATLIAAFTAVGDNTTLAVGVADAGSIGWAADSGSGTAMFTARHVGGSDRRLLSQTTLPPARRDDALIPVAIQDPNDPTNVLTYRFTKDDLITFVTAGIEALTADNRLDYGSLKNTPTIPPPFEVGDITTMVAIADDDRLVFSDQSEADNPNRYTTFEDFKNAVRESVQDEGVVVNSHPDFLNFIGTGVTVTDSGTGVNITFTGGADAAGVLTALQAMSDVQETQARAALKTIPTKTGIARDSSKDISSTVLRSAAANINPYGMTWDGTSVLVLDLTNDAVWGFTNGARDNTKDISQAVLRSASSAISPQGIAWDGSSVLIADGNGDAVWGFTNGARDTSKDISQAVLRSAAANISPSGMTWDGSSVLVADSVNDAVWGFTNGARDASKDIPTAVLRSASSTISPFGLTWDGSSVLVADGNDAVWGFTNGARDTSKDIPTAVLQSAAANIAPQGTTWDGSSVLIADATNDTVWGFVRLPAASEDALFGSFGGIGAALRDFARTSLGLQGANLTVTASNNNDSQRNGEIIIIRNGTDFEVYKGTHTPSGAVDSIVINYT